MYKVIFYDDNNQFMAHTFPGILKREINNNLFISNVLREQLGGKSNDLRIGITDEDGQMVFSAILTNPYNLVLVEIDPSKRRDILPLLVLEFEKKNIALPGVIGEVSLIDDFVAEYQKRISLRPKTKLLLNLMALTQVNPLAATAGMLRLATEEDLYYLPYWQSAFCEECGLTAPSLQESHQTLKNTIERKALYIWEDHVPVSCVSSGRPIYTGKTITFVYTPPYFRNKGYASSSVAAVSHILLDQGAAFCGLYADCDNPISNNIYRKIGYQDVSICKEVVFE